MQFSADQRCQVIRAIDEAELRTAQYYCIPPFRWEQLPYDLLTRQDPQWAPLPDPVLAQVQRLQKWSPRPLKSFDFFRIQLNDPAILGVVERESLATCFYPFMVYILTHEMVHLVRLSTILEPEDQSSIALETEEQRVQSISRKILSDGDRAAFSPILERFCASQP
jgi:hypothetical protein